MSENYIPKFYDADTVVDSSIRDTGTLVIFGNPVSSLVMVGIPTVPTAEVGTNTEQVASTAFVHASISLYQPLDADLTALSQLTGTGYAHRLEDGTWSLESGSSSVSWGAIGGTLTNQTDLVEALNSKANTADLGDSATKDVGTTSGTVAAGDDSRIVAGGTALQANQTITLSGDATGSGTTAITVTLSNSGVSAGSYGSATSVSAITVDVKGRVTAITATSIQIAESQVTNLPADLAAKAALAGATFTGDVAITESSAMGNLLTITNTDATNYSRIKVVGTGNTYSFGVGNATATISELRNNFYIYDFTGTKAILIGTPSGVWNFPQYTASRALALDASKNIVVSTTTLDELAYVHGVTSPIQTQADAKLAKASNLSDLTNVGIARGSIGLRYLPQDNLLPDKGRFAGVLANPYSLTTPYTAYTASTISVVGSTFTLHSSVAGFNVTTFAVGKLVNILGCTNAGNNNQVIVASVTTSDITFSGDVSTMVDEAEGASITLRAHTYVAGMAFMHLYYDVTESIVGKVIYNNTTYGGIQGALSSSANNWVTSANSLVPMSTRYVPERGVIRYTVGGTTGAYHQVTYNHNSLLFGIGNYASWSGWLRLVSGTADFGYLTGSLSSVDGASYTSGSKTLSSDGNFHFYRVVQKPSLPYDNGFPGIRADGGSLIELVCPAFYNGWVPAESIEINPIIGLASWDGVTL